MRSSAAKLMCTSARAATTDDISRMRGRVRIWKYTAPEPETRNSPSPDSRQKASTAPRSADRRNADRHQAVEQLQARTAMPVLYFVGLLGLWILQFLLFRTRRKSTPVKTASVSRWGMLFQFLGYWVIFFPARTAWTDPIPAWRLVVAIAFGLLGIWLASTGVRHLGNQWRMKAALNADDELVTSGPYRIIR